METYTGTSNLQANWSANTINITWYNDDAQFASNSCTYGGPLTMPNDIPTKPGYTFAGWRVKQSGGNGGGQQSQNSCFDHYSCGLNDDLVSEYNSFDSGLIGFSHGTVSMVTSCNNTLPNVLSTIETAISNGTMDWEEATDVLWGSCDSDAIKPGNTSFDSTGEQCWCKIVDYTPNGGSTCNISSSVWVWNNDLDTISGYNCAEHCSRFCLQYIEAAPVFRRALFSGSSN